MRKVSGLADQAVVVGVLLVALAIYDFVLNSSYIAIVSEEQIASWLILLFTGLILVFYRNKTRQKTIGITAAAIGLGMIVESCPYMLTEGDFLELLYLALSDNFTLIFIEEYIFAIGLMTFILGAINLCEGVKCLLNICKDSKLMRLATEIEICITLAVPIAEYCIINSLELFWNMLWPVIPSLIFYIAFLVLLDVDEFKTPSDVWTIDHDLYRLRTAIDIDSDTVMLRSDMTKLRGCIENDSGWQRTDVDGTVDKESVFDLINKRMADRQLLLQRHRDGRTILSVAGRNTGSYAVGLFVDVKEMFFDGDPETCRHMRVYGDGSYLSITISDRDMRIRKVDKLTGPIRSFIRRGSKTTENKRP